MARRAGDPTRDLPDATREAVRAKLPGHLLPVLDGEEENEELPSGLVLAEVQDQTT